MVTGFGLAVKSLTLHIRKILMQR